MNYQEELTKLEKEKKEKEEQLKKNQERRKTEEREQPLFCSHCGAKNYHRGDAL